MSFNFCIISLLKILEAYHLLSGNSDNLGSISCVLNHVNTIFTMNTAFTDHSQAGNPRRYSGKVRSSPHV